MALMTGLSHQQCLELYADALRVGNTDQLRKLCKEDLFFLLTVALRRKDADNDFVYARCHVRLRLIVMDS